MFKWLLASIVVIVVTSTSHAKEIMRMEDPSRGAVASLYDEKCTNEVVLSMADALEMQPKHKKQLKRATLHVGSGAIEGCYIVVVENESMFLMDETGFIGPVSLEHYKKMKDRNI